MSAAKSLKVRRLEPLLTYRQWQRIARRLAMSERELQIAKLVFDDQTETAIATRLGIALSTVHTHMKRLFRKLDVKTRVGLVLRVIREDRADAEQHGRQIPIIGRTNAAIRMWLPQGSSSRKQQGKTHDYRNA